MANTNPLIGRTFPLTRERIEPLYKNRIQADLRRKQMKEYSRKRARLKRSGASDQATRHLTKDSGYGIT